MPWQRDVRDFFRGMAYGQHERALLRQAAELNDLFLLLCYMKIVGLPNPATLYLLDVYPYLLDQFPFVAPPHGHGSLAHRERGRSRRPRGRSRSWTKPASVWAD